MSNLTFETVKFSNFLSFGNIETVVDLTSPGTTFLVGENLDNGGSSGAGKTTLISALSYALYDKVPSNISKDRLINGTNAKKNTTMRVETVFTKGADKYRIVRFRGDKTGAQLFENGKDITPASVIEINSKIEQIVGFSYELFSQIILFDGNSIPFLDLPVGKQRDLIEELFCITLLSAKGTSCKTASSETEKQLGMQRLLIQQQELQNEGHKRRLADAEQRVERWRAEHETRLQNLQVELQRLSAIDFDAEEQLHAAIAELQTEITKHNGEVQVLRSQLTAKQNEKPEEVTELAVLSTSLKTKKRDLEQLVGELKHLREARCPYCKQAFEAAREKISDREQAASKLTAATLEEEALETLLQERVATAQAAIKSDIARLQDLVSNKQLEAQTITGSIAELKSASMFANVQDLHKARTAITTVQSELLKTAPETNPHVDALNALRAEGEVKIDRSVIEELLTVQEHQKFLIKLLMDKSSFIRKNIIGKTIPFLNKRIGYYTEKLTLPHVVLFQPDMSCEISQMGRVLDHGNLSNGEKKRLNLALCLAFRDVLTYLHQKVNILFTDEIDGGSLDSHIVDALIGLLKRKAWDDGISIYIISHRPEFEGRCDRNLIIRKEGGFSTLITQPED